MSVEESITAISGVTVGSAEDNLARTGCTAILLPEGSIVACDARGGWPGTYDTDSIGLTKRFIEKHAIFLTGGDVFGFDAAIGIRSYLLERGLARRVGAGLLPGIVGADIYDLEFADVPKAHYVDLGYRSCEAANSGPVKEGNFGAGLGATVGKLLDRDLACKGGQGTACVSFNEFFVGALVVTNSFGNIYDYSNGRTIAGCRNPKGRGFVEFEETMNEYLSSHDEPQGTTIGAVLTNAPLEHEQLFKIAQMAHNGLAMSIKPVHTSTDGDTIFAVTTQSRKSGERSNLNLVDIIGHLAATQVAKAVRRSVLLAHTLNGIPGCFELE